MKNLAAWIVLAGLAGCQPNIEQPSVPDDKMARIMADLSVSEAAANGITGYAHDSLAQFYYRQVLELHGVTLEEYERNLRLLSNDIPRLEAIMDSSLSILQQKLPPGGASKLNVPKE